MIQIMSKLKLTRVNNSNEHKKELFNLLKMRNFLISHEGKISFSTHCQFVEDHPYRQWFFIEFCNKIIGSIYISKDNSLGIDLNKENLIHLAGTLNILYKKYKPLKGINSVRNKNFFINVSDKNNYLKQALKRLGYSPIQTSYQLKK